MSMDIITCVIPREPQVNRESTIFVPKKYLPSSILFVHISKSLTQVSTCTVSPKSGKNDLHVCPIKILNMCFHQVH
jgi:hypothetical protein